MSERCTDAPQSHDIWGTDGGMGMYSHMGTYRCTGECSEIWGAIKIYRGTYRCPQSDSCTKMPDNSYMHAN